MRILVSSVLVVLNLGMSESLCSLSLILLSGSLDIGYAHQISNQMKRYKLNTVTVAGVEFLDRARIIRISGIRLGTEFNTESIEKGIEEIKKEYIRLGFIKATVSFDKELRSLADGKFDGIADLTIKIDQGDRFYIGIIEFYGNNKTRHKMLQSAAGLNIGEPYNPYKVENWVRGLNKLNRLETVKKEDIEIEIDEKKEAVFIRFHIREKEK